MATIVDDSFLGAAGSIDGRVVSGHMWQVASGTVTLNGSGAAVLSSTGGAYMSVPEIAGSVDYEFEFGVESGARADSFVAAIRSTPTVGYLVLISDLGNLIVHGATSISSSIIGAPLVAGDTVTVRFEWSSGVFTLLVNGSTVATRTLVATVDTPFLTLDATSEPPPPLPAFSHVAVRTIGSPPETPAFWSQIQQAREVI